MALSFFASTVIRNIALSTGVALLLGVTGCQGKKVVARIGNATINEEQFNERVQRVAQIGQQTDAGGTALIEMVRETLVEELVKEKKWTPSEESVSQFNAYLIRRNPTFQDALKQGRIDNETLLRNARLSTLEFVIGTDNSKVEEKDLQATYDAEKERLKVPDSAVIRLMPVPSETVGEQALAELKKNPDPKAMAQKLLGIPAVQAANYGKETTTVLETLLPSIRTEVEKLAPGQYTPKTIKATVQDPQTGQQQTAFVIAQLIEKKQGSIPTLQEVRPVVERIFLSKKFPQWSEHKDQLIAEYVNKLASANLIQINIKRYEPLLNDVILFTAQSRMRVTPTSGVLGSPTGAPALGAPTGAGAPPPGNAPAPGAPGAP